MPVSTDTQGRAAAGIPVAHAEDLVLAKSVLSGSAEAWQTFIGRYSRLIAAVIRRYVPNRGDDARSLQADVLQSLYRGGLAHYAGRAALSTWLVAVTRAAVVDDVRRRVGGRRLHAVTRAAVVDDVRRRVGGRRLQSRLKGLEPYEREVFRLYYLEGLSFGTVLRMARDQGAQATPDRLLLALQRIEDRVTDRLARRLRYDLHAQSVAGASGRLLEYLDHMRTEAEVGMGTQDPEYRLMEREARQLIDDVQAVVGRLPADERQILSLRFEQGWSAARISEELGLDGQRSVYTRLDRIVRGLRRALGVLRP